MTVMTPGLAASPTTTSSSIASMNKDPSMPGDYFSGLPTEILIEIYKRCDALTLYLSWDEASRYLASSARKPSPLQIWIATLESDSPLDIGSLPLVERDAEHSGGEQMCLPDASIVCTYLRSKSMLQRIYDSKFPVAGDVFYDSYRAPSPMKAVHAAMRNCWFELIDVWNLSMETKEDFSIHGSHWGYFNHLVTLRHSFYSRSDEFFDFAAQNGELDLLKRLPGSITGTKNAMDHAAWKGRLDVVKWLHSNRTEGCTKYAMDRAASNGHLDVVRWLHENRSEGCNYYAMNGAARNGHLRVVQFLYTNRNEGSVDIAIGYARRFGHIDIVEYLGGSMIDSEWLYF